MERTDLHRYWLKLLPMNNFLLRTVTAVAFVAVMVGCLLFEPLLFGALFLVVMVVAIGEFYRMSLGGRHLAARKLGLLTAASFFTMVFCTRLYGMDSRWMALCILPALGILVSCFFEKDHSDFGGIAYVLAALLCIGLPLCCAPLMVINGAGEFNGFILFSVFIVIWGCDVGAYCIGTLLGCRPGARKMAPSISPKKSWWGFWGGLSVGLLASCLTYLTGWLPYPLHHCLVLGVIVSLASICGDLSESMWKRYFGVKDSGNCIPGHGGMYDRFDSSLFAIPAATCYLALFELL